MRVVGFYSGGVGGLDVGGDDGTVVRLTPNGHYDALIFLITLREVL